MPKVKFTSALKRFFPDLEEVQLPAHRVSELLESLDGKYPGLSDYLIDENGHLRKHVNVFVGEEMIKDRQGLSDQLNEGDEVLIFQALSGG